MQFFAETLAGVFWWDPSNQTGAHVTISGDGEWTYTIKVATVQDEEGNEVLAGGAFAIEVNDENGHYITTLSNGSGWTFGEGVEGTIAGNSEYGNGYVVGTSSDGTPVDTYRVTVTRTGNDWVFAYYEVGTEDLRKIVQIKCTGANLSGDIDLHFMAEVGTYDVTIKGTGSGEEDDGSGSDNSETDEGNVVWGLDENGTLTLSGTGEISFSLMRDLRTKLDVSTIKKVVIEDGITAIGESAFEQYGNLEEVSIPDSVTIIAPFSFVDCSSLKGVNIPDSVTSIGAYAFCDCDSLKEITIPSSVTYLGGQAFWGCDSLEKVTISSYGLESFSDFGTFADCTSLKEINIPNSVIRFEWGETFAGCTSLTEITIPDSVIQISSSVFENCSSLSKVYFYGDAPASYFEDPSVNDMSGAVGTSGINFSVGDPVYKSIFIGVTATVYYPKGNDTWTKEIMEALAEGGNITWIEFEPGEELFGGTDSSSLKIQLEFTDMTYILGSEGGATIKCSGALADFVSVAVDGVIVNPSNYTLEEGSTILTFTSEFMDMLPVGDYTITMNYTYGSIDMVMGVAKASPVSPKTGDASLLFVLAFAALMAGSGMVLAQRKCFRRK